MNAPAYQVVAGNMVREVETPAPSPRLEKLLARALSLGLSADIVTTPEYGSVLVANLFHGEPGSRLLGGINVWPATETSEERWNLSASCNVLGAIPEQADWLTEGATRLRAVFARMVAS